MRVFKSVGCKGKMCGVGGKGNDNNNSKIYIASYI